MFTCLLIMPFHNRNGLILLMNFNKTLKSNPSIRSHIKELGWKLKYVKRRRYHLIGYAWISFWILIVGWEDAQCTLKSAGRALFFYETDKTIQLVLNRANHHMGPHSTKIVVQNDYINICYAMSIFFLHQIVNTLWII